MDRSLKLDDKGLGGGLLEVGLRTESGQFRKLSVKLRDELGETLAAALYRLPCTAVQDKPFGTLAVRSASYTALSSGLGACTLLDAYDASRERETDMSIQNEIVRIVATVGQVYSEDASRLAAYQVLDWAAQGLEKPLPDHARDLRPFKHFTGGVNCTAVSIHDGDRDVWAIRVDRADDFGPKCIRSTEAVVERRVGQRTTLTVRSLADRDPRYDSVPPEVPSFIHRIDGELGLYSLWEKFESTPWLVTTEEDCRKMMAMLVDSTRIWPVFVLTVPEESHDLFTPLLEPEPLAWATTGLARVIVLPHQFTWDLTNRFGKILSVYLGAVRIYLPGFDETADRFAHELVLPRRLEVESDRVAVMAKLQRVAAEASLRRFELGRDIREFAAIRKEAEEEERKALQRRQPEPPPPSTTVPGSPVVEAEIESPSLMSVASELPAAPIQEAASSPSAPSSSPPTPISMPATSPPAPSPAQEPGPPAATGSDSSPALPEPDPNSVGLIGRIAAKIRSIVGGQQPDTEIAFKKQIKEARKEIKALRAKLQESEEENKWLLDEHAEVEKRATKAETELAIAKERIEELKELLSRMETAGGPAMPQSWPDFSDWCGRELAGKVMLAERAQREVKKAKFRDVELAANGLIWLGNEYRRQRLEGGSGSLRGPNSSGLSNEPCGSPRFTIPWGGRQMNVKWHLKNGNTHDPTRCLRIYYFWDNTNKQVIVASMPGHYRVMGR